MYIIHIFIDLYNHNGDVSPPSQVSLFEKQFNPLNAELNPACHLLAFLGDETIVVVSRLRVKYKERP